MSQTIEYPDGIRLTLPDDAPEGGGEAPPRRSRSGRGGRYAPRPLPAAAALTPEGEDVAAAFEAQGFAVTPLDLPPDIHGAARRSGERRSLDLDVALEEDEHAVLLVEQEGLYAWKMPDSEEASPATGAVRRSAGQASVRTARFALSLDGEGEEDAPRVTRGFIRDLVVGKLLGRARVYVLRFIAQRAVGAAAGWLERHVRTGLLRLDAGDPTGWQLLADDRSPVPLPDAGRPLRLLLFLHGTFSSTVGAFGALAAYPWGQHVLAEAGGAYDAVLGYDHPTLTADPRANAEDLLRRLRAYAGGRPVRLDVVTHSRGGLVYRSLAEYVLPGADWKPEVGRVVFVGTPNAGTALAEPANWHALIDLYTNLAAGACRALALLPQAAFAAGVLREMLQSLGALVKALATEAVRPEALPGLAAMQPEGAFLRDLNAEQPGQPGLDRADYCAVTAAFEARLSGDHEPRELPARLLTALAGGVTGRLFREASDLVVNTASMTAIDAEIGPFVRDRLDLGTGPHVYHTNYFAQPRVVAALARWLGLPEPPDPTSPQRRRRSAAARTLPVAVSDAFITATADDPAGELLERLYDENPAYVVVLRAYEGRTLHYAYSAEEARSMLAFGALDAPLLHALAMHEYQASPEAPLGGGLPTAAPTAGPTTGRAVVMEGGVPVGVVSEAPRMLSADELAALAAPPQMADGGGGDPPPEPSAPPPRRRGGRRDLEGTPPEASAPEEWAPEATPPETAAPERVTCHFQADMPARVQVGKEVTLLVAVAREALEAAAGRATATGQAGEVDPLRKLILDVRPRRNFEVVGESRAEVDPPPPGAPTELYFDLRATDEGEGEVHVTARQGQTPLVTLKLFVEVVAEAPARRGRAHAEAEAAEAPPATRPLRQLRIFERDNGRAVHYEYDLDLPGVAFDKYLSPPFKADRQQYVDALYREIEDRWLSSNRDQEDFTEELRALGASMFDQLFPPEMQRVIWENRAAIDSIQVISTEPFIPWELVHLREPGRPGLPDEPAFLGQLGLVRWLHGTWFPEELRIRPGRARYVIPDYPHPDDRLPEASEEAGFLEDRFGAEAVEAQPKPVRDLLRAPGAFDLLHFACHGEAEHENITMASLSLQGRVENGRAVPAYLSATTVAAHARLAGPDGARPLVVLNACQAGRLGFQLTKVGGFAEAFLRAGAGAFVGTLWSVADAPARSFTEALYAALLDGDTLGEATRKAREAARYEDASWLAYAVYGHPYARLRTD